LSDSTAKTGPPAGPNDRLWGTTLLSVGLLTGIFCFTFLGRIIFGPLLLEIEADLGLSHAQAARLLLIIAAGYAAALLCSGLVSSRLGHRRTISLSALGLGAALGAASLSRSLLSLQIGLPFLGMAAGLYLPSGLSTLTSLVRQRLWGRVMALHQIGPNLSFIGAPLLAQLAASLLSWRGLLLAIGLSSLALGLLHLRAGRGGDFPGAVPRLATLGALLANPSIWAMMGIFGLAVGTQLGVYSLVPAYLVSDQGISQAAANTVLAASRISALGVAFLSGWLVDRWGLKRSLEVFCLVCGATTIALGLAPASWQLVLVLIQALGPACLFPACFVAMSRVVSREMRNLSVGLVVPVGHFLGGGAVPAVLGWLGDRGLWGLGFLGLGLLGLAGAFLARVLRLTDQ